MIALLFALAIPTFVVGVARAVRRHRLAVTEQLLELAATGQAPDGVELPVRALAAWAADSRRGAR